MSFIVILGHFLVHLSPFGNFLTLFGDFCVILVIRSFFGKILVIFWSFFGHFLVILHLSWLKSTWMDKNLPEMETRINFFRHFRATVCNMVSFSGLCTEKPRKTSWFFCFQAWLCLNHRLLWHTGLAAVCYLFGTQNLFASVCLLHSGMFLQVFVK